MVRYSGDPLNARCVAVNDVPSVRCVPSMLERNGRASHPHRDDESPQREAVTGVYGDEPRMYELICGRGHRRVVVRLSRARQPFFPRCPHCGSATVIATRLPEPDEAVIDREEW